MSTRNQASPLTVGELLAHLQAGKRAREFDNTPGIRTLCNLSLSWFGEDLTAATFNRLRFEGALRLGKYLDGNDPRSIDAVSIRTLATMLRAARDRFSNLSPPPIEAIENADAVVRAETTATVNSRGKADYAEEAGPPPPARKRSTERSEGQVKLIAALTKHHRYADGGCLNLEPIGCSELAELAGVSKSTASAFLKSEFKGNVRYKALCRDASGLAAALKLLNGEFSPHLLYDRCPASEADRNDE